MTFAFDQYHLNLVLIFIKLKIISSEFFLYTYNNFTIKNSDSL